ncbi:ABC transporter ATP-binding protein [Gramella sp. GC03-9]|uniref:ABC transporter ATP-binding protein n=1 Tax=Christiangramia oceanisediminis TaxID=2920386 RepID=A0A9X2KVN8_9FLAO|nr:ABC transporter ATP-binding protein [Gramella oceanisediminis]MCP9198389.1 ABC transporter ATP-binding protein [Gramella oceanisediminis]
MTFELDNVELSYNGRKILYGVYVKAEKGQITGILGSNGCGKTSLLRIFFGNLNCNNKLVRIDGKGTLEKLYRKRKIRFLPQGDLLPENIDLRKLFGIYRVSWNNFLQHFEEFRKYGLHRIKELSGGEQRLVAIWLSLKSESDLVLLDEPFSHLSPKYIEIIKRELFKEKIKKAIVITDHLYEEILEMSDHMYLIQNGCSRPVNSRKDLKEFGYIN